MEDTLIDMVTILGVTEDSEINKCKLYLLNAANVIMEIRQMPYVENKYQSLQVQMAIELYNKQGVEGEVSHSENGISRGYSSTFISKNLLDQITPRVKPLTQQMDSIPMPL